MRDEHRCAHGSRSLLAACARIFELLTEPTEGITCRYEMAVGSTLEA